MTGIDQICKSKGIYFGGIALLDGAAALFRHANAIDVFERRNARRHANAAFCTHDEIEQHQGER